MTRPPPMRVCVITGARSEYGLLKPILVALERLSTLEVQLIVAGGHLAASQGMTERAVLADDRIPDGRVACVMDDDTRAGMARSFGLAALGFANEIERLAPRIVLVLGDRYEALAAASAAAASGVPVAHIAGGHVTEGAVDDSFRHAITKLASVHFTAIAPYRDRIVQMGEAPDRIFIVGSTGLDNIRKLELLDRAGLLAELGIESTRGRLFSVTYHSETGAPGDDAGFEALTAAVRDASSEDIFVFTAPNADAGGRSLKSRIEALCAEAPKRRRLFTSLGERRYLSLLRAANAVLGNSSSGIIEAPSFTTPTVNIGDRQKGRLRAVSVIDTPGEAEAVKAAIEKACDQTFLKTLCGMKNPYGDGRSGERIASIIAALDPENLLPKRFVDRPVTDSLR